MLRYSLFGISNSVLAGKLDQIVDQPKRHWFSDCPYGHMLGRPKRGAELSLS